MKETSQRLSLFRQITELIQRYQPVKSILGQDYYIPGEFCDPIGEQWFYDESDWPRSDEELLGMYLVAISRNANFLLNVPTDTNGTLPGKWIKALMRLRKRLDLLGLGCNFGGLCC